ncbi:uncharacterized protein PHACADRAFT_266003 [Phanerochaete carnosa HHB-10118-sp]|uniref:Uncharacterized protein n=1 Tax=Phanerochaete carnosa (strain HHB-10118-sp) TaxID=650164 RepID=K5WFE7_PHACS|nr:uncharacterized protein PHACADRAFT_266003 [Phanerochaete carnosa HHB-10118-sp]EKM48892.1 hypothetical protein PHACADRAFT_266003 [Phanerochaete carnosa HHB-10118-sp]
MHRGHVLFRAALTEFKPSAAKDVSCILELADRNWRAGSSVELVLTTYPSLHIAFSRIGLNVLGVKNGTTFSIRRASTLSAAQSRSMCMSFTAPSELRAPDMHALASPCTPCFHCYRAAMSFK